MASSEDTAWDFAKAELPTTTKHDTTCGDEHPGHIKVQHLDTGYEREDNKSSSTISGKPVLDQRLAKSLKIVNRRRDRLVEGRVKIDQQRREHEYQRKAVHASNQRILDATETFLKRFGIDASSSPEYLEIVGALKESTDRAKILGIMETQLQQSAEAMNLKEAEMFSKERKVYKRLATLTGLTNHPPSRELPRPERSTSSKSTTHTHPRARKYYDRAGDVKNLRDKIHNLHVEHQQDLILRQARRDSGHATKLPERLFHERFYTKLTSILEELESAKKDAILLKLACERQGIVLEEEAETHRGQVEHYSPMLENDHVILPKLGHQISRNSSLLLDELLSGYNDTTTRIRRWLNGIPQNTQEPDDLQLLADHHSVDPVLDINVALDSPSPGPMAMYVPAPVEKRLTASLYVQQSRRPFTIEDPDDEAIETASALSGEPSSFSGREFPQEDFIGEAPMRRYSDPNPEFTYWLRPIGAQKVLHLSQGNDSHRSRRNSH
ncbi:hypothetical protein FKW77_004771 [Venturia effusa]|uniref:Uncharacterized protein n=1 Tax=Venturia effusa TaxID=50376 RepID=A0A517L194_9PEZI|nr:hypothetical protein FKW77_004771 [Venturia effusa]